MNRYPQHHTLQTQQRGVALAISLILLVVITMLSLTAMRSANLDTKIAVNHQHKQLSFQAAENSLAHLTSLTTAEMKLLQVPNVIGVYATNTNVVTNTNFPPGNSADLDMTLLEISTPGKYKFSGFGFDIITVVYQADAVGSITNTNATSHNRMDVALIRD